MVPAELGGGLVRPELEGLGLDGDGGLDAAAKALVALHQLAADVRQRAHRDAEHHLIEVLAAPQRARPPPQRGGLALGRDPALERRAAEPLRPRAKLLPARLAGPAGQPLDVHQRVIGVHAGRQPDLLHHLDRVDHGGVASQPEPLDVVKELEAHATALQDLVEGREDRVSHPRLHLVHDRAAVAEGQSQQVARRGARRAIGLSDHSVRVGEGHVVDRAQHR